VCINIPITYFHNHKLHICLLRCEEENEIRRLHVSIFDTVWEKEEKEAAAAAAQEGGI
jgi:hypothetical protein